MSAGGPVLEARDLRTTLVLRDGSFDVVRGVSLALCEGETLALVGESGCGKTMTALSIMRLLPDPPARITGGEVWLDGREITKVSAKAMRELRGDQVSMVFQEPLTSLDPVFTIGAQLTEVVTAHRDTSRDDAEEMAVEMLREVQIPSPERRLKDYPHQLSGGMRQRVMIAMALACRPLLVLADEPVTALDVMIQAQIMDLLHDLRADLSLAMILISHDLSVIAETCDRVAIMYGGRLVEIGSVVQVFRQPAHPYSRGLLRAFPNIHGKREFVSGIPGYPPSLTNPPPGCRFYERCPARMQICEKEGPQLRAIADGHSVACLLYGGEA